MFKFLNPRRLHDYPYLFLIAIIILLMVNIIFHQGWLGGFGQLLGGDYVMFYATGLSYRTDINLIYNYSEQYRIQESLVQPTQLLGYNPFMNPPYVAMAFSLLPLLPLEWSLVVWSIFSILCCILSVYLFSRYLPLAAGIGMTFKHLLVLTISFFPFIEGLQAGQNHAITLVLVTGILISAYHERWLLAGILAGSLIYKPQLVIGIIIVWVVWRNIKALVGFSSIVMLWAGSFVLLHGITPFLQYLETSHFLMLLPYQEGFPGYIITTLFGLLTSIMPTSMARILQAVSYIFFILAGAAITWVAYRQRKSPHSIQIPILAVAFIYPLALSPYVQYHDLLLIVPVFIAWAANDHSQSVLKAAILTYLGAFLLLLLSVLTGIAWVAMIPIGLFLAALYRIFPQISDIPMDPA